LHQWLEKGGNTMQRAIIGAAILLTTASSPAFSQVMSGEFGEMENEAVLAGFLGSSFGGEFDDQTITYGGSLSWLWSRMLGAEVLAGFAPNLSLVENLDDTQINNYMVNVIMAAPLGVDGRWQPFVSGGLGALTLSTGQDVQQALNVEADEADLGANLGLGLLAFAESWGVRGDIRYFSQVGDPDADALFIDDVNFWRSNIGIAYRW
jgi:hypothetical protein